MAAPGNATNEAAALVTATWTNRALAASALGITIVGNTLWALGTHRHTKSFAVTPVVPAPGASFTYFSFANPPFMPAPCDS